MLNEFFFVADEKLSPEGGVYHGDSGQVFEAAAAKGCDARILSTFDKGAGDYVAELACEADFIVVDVAGGFGDAGKAHGGNQVPHEVQVVRAVAVLRN